VGGMMVVGGIVLGFGAGIVLAMEKRHMDGLEWTTNVM